jgi:uncharacterized glyoxalase superfamily protein PhnB
MMTYGECEDLGIPLAVEHKELIHSAVLLHPSGCRLFMCDSITLLLSHDSIGEINKGHLSAKGCRDGSAFEVANLSEDEITALYKQLIENQSIVHIQLGARGNLKLYASVMDRFNLTWNLSCE